MNKRSQRDIRPAIDARLSGVTPDGQTAQHVLSRAENRIIRHKKLSLIPILVLILLLALAAAAYATFTFGVLDFIPGRESDARYIESIIGIGDDFENEYMTLRVNEAAFDSARLDLTMDIRHRDGAGVVYVIPSMQAYCGGKPLPLSIETINFSWDEGFFLPEQQPLHMETEQAGVSFILEDAPQSGEITWSLSFDVLRPVYRIALNPRSLDPEEGEEEIPFDVYIQDYLDAYEKGIILLTDDGRLFMYDGALSMGAEFGENPWYREGLAQRMIDCGAFERVETLTSSFVTKQ